MAGPSHAQGVSGTLDVTDDPAMTQPQVAPRPAQSVQGGPVGPQGPRMREQWWLIPGPEQHLLRATVFRPPGDQPRRLAIISHGTGRDPFAIGLPVFYYLTRWLVRYGDYVVVIPLRRGYGATGGIFRERAGTCANPDYTKSEFEQARDIKSVIDFMVAQPFVKKDGILLLGGSTGGLGALATAHYFPDRIGAVVNFSGGRGGRAGGVAGRVCSPSALEAAAAKFAKNGGKPTLWLYSENDTYFPPSVARGMRDAFLKEGGRAEFYMFPPFKTDGHQLMGDADGFSIWAEALALFLYRHAPH